MFKVPNRKVWDHSAINFLAKEAQPYEILFGEKLKNILKSEDGYSVKHHLNPFHRHDYIVTHTAFPQHNVLLELECGKDQHQWVNTIHDNRYKWVFGLNVLSRKIVEGQHYDIFIKHNLTGTSFFATTPDFVQQHGKPITLKKTSLKFNTDHVVYSIPWSIVDSPEENNSFCADDPNKLRDMVYQIFTQRASSEIAPH